MPAPLIGITTYASNEDDEFALPAQYVSAIHRAGGMAALLPPGETAPDELLARLDGLVLAGGDDVDPDLYGGRHHPEVYNVSRQRDAFELGLARRVLAEQRPTLAICRGLQLVNVALGGTLHEHLPDVVGQEILHRLPPRKNTLHPVTAVAETQLAGLLGNSPFEASSSHHQSIDRLGRGLVAAAHTADGTIEAVELPGQAWLHAVQWHPETTAEVDPLQQSLFDSLVAACGTSARPAGSLA